MPQPRRIAKDISGLKFARLTAIKNTTQGKHPRWEFKCDCGNSKIILKEHVVAGRTKSCGCLLKEVMSGRNTTHGMTKTKCFTTWQRIKDRCDNVNNQDYHLYGGRGITYCNSWKEFKNFFNDMGNPPNSLSIDRIDVNGNYEPSNCRWATPTEQANNKRNNVFIEFNGERKTMAEWERILGLKTGTIHMRLKKGCDTEDALRIKYTRKRGGR